MADNGDTSVSRVNCNFFRSEHGKEICRTTQASRETEKQVSDALANFFNAAFRKPEKTIDVSNAVGKETTAKE